MTYLSVAQKNVSLRDSESRSLCIFFVQTRARKERLSEIISGERAQFERSGSLYPSRVWCSASAPSTSIG